MNPDLNVSTVKAVPPLKALLVAIAAPFGAIVLLAAPLAFETLKHALGF
jgi:hypothetical protein